MNKNVKKCLIIVFILACIGLICYGVYSIVNNVDTAPTSSKTTTEKSSDELTDNRVLIASLPDDDFKLYQVDDKLVLEHKGATKEFEWTGYFTEKLTKMAYADYNGDGKKEIAIVITQDGTNGKTTQQLHILSILENGGNVEYRDTGISSTTINRDVEIGEDFDAVQSENKKRVEFKLGEDTFYFQAPPKEDGTYHDFLAMSIGSCTFDIKDGKITSSIELSASFNNMTEEVVPGNIISNIVFSEEQYRYTENDFAIAKGFGISPPISGNITPYSITIKNNNAKISTDLTLNNVTFSLEPLNSANRDFDAGTSDERYLSSIEITQDYIRLALIDNMKFDSFWIENGHVVIWMGTEHEGYFVHKSSEITHQDGYYYLTTYFDEKIPHDQLKTINYSYGSSTQE